MDKKLKVELETLAKENLITDEQLSNIYHYYSKKESKSHEWYLSTLPWLAAILLILGLFSFVAANWSVLENFSKLSILLGSLVLSTLLGNYFSSKNKMLFSNISFLLAATLFGSSLILTAQMYHLVSYSAVVFFIWSIGIFAYYLSIGNNIFFFYSIIISIVGLLYSNTQLYGFPYIYVLVLTLLYCFYAYKEKNLKLNYFTVSFLLLSWSIFFTQSFYFTGKSYLNDLLIYVIPSLVPVLILSVGLIVVRNNKYFAPLIELPILIALFFWSIQSIDVFYNEGFNQTAIITHFVILLGIIGCTLYFIGLNGLKENIEKYILFIPLFYFIPSENKAEYVPILILLTYAIALLVKGYKKLKQNTFRNGTIIFVLAIVLLYFQVSYTFLSKSLFFFTLSLIVLVVYATLQWFMKDGRGAKNEK